MVTTFHFLRAGLLRYCWRSCRWSSWGSTCSSLCPLFLQVFQGLGLSTLVSASQASCTSALSSTCPSTYSFRYPTATATIGWVCCYKTFCKRVCVSQLFCLGVSGRLIFTLTLFSLLSMTKLWRFLGKFAPNLVYEKEEGQPIFYSEEGFPDDDSRSPAIA